MIKRGSTNLPPLLGGTHGRSVKVRTSQKATMQGHPQSETDAGQVRAA
jgi:hypothetical protein